MHEPPPIQRPVVEVGSFTRAEREAEGFEERLNAYCEEVGYTTDRQDMFWRMEQDGRLVLYRKDERSMDVDARQSKREVSKKESSRERTERIKRAMTKGVSRERLDQAMTTPTQRRKRKRNLKNVLKYGVEERRP